MAFFFVSFFVGAALTLSPNSSQAKPPTCYKIREQKKVRQGCSVVLLIWAMPFGHHGDLMKMWNGKTHGDLMKMWNGKTREFGICSLLQRFAHSCNILLTLAKFCSLLQVLLTLARFCSLLRSFAHSCSWTGRLDDRYFLSSKSIQYCRVRARQTRARAKAIFPGILLKYVFSSLFP